ncbi:unnamed protein product, partial [Amoebophrya sp. A120]
VQSVFVRYLYTTKVEKSLSIALEAQAVAEDAAERAEYAKWSAEVNHNNTEAETDAGYAWLEAGRAAESALWARRKKETAVLAEEKAASAAWNADHEAWRAKSTTAAYIARQMEMEARHAAWLAENNLEPEPGYGWQSYEAPYPE